MERFQAAQHALADAADTYCTHCLAFEVVLVLRHGSHVPFTTSDLLMRGDKVADQSQDRHENMLCN